MYRRGTGIALVVGAVVLLLAGCNPILNLVGLGSVVVEDFELDSTTQWTLYDDGLGSTIETVRTSDDAIGGEYSLEVTFAVSTADGANGAGLKREFDGGAQDWSKLTAVSFQMNPNNAEGTVTVALLDSDGTQLAYDAAAEPLPFSGDRWTEFYFDFGEFAAVTSIPGEVPGFDWERVEAFVLWFASGEGTVYVDDIVGEWSLFK